MRHSLGRTAGLVALWCLLAPLAQAHQGPPFPIVMDRKVGPYVVSVWADPNVGIGKFFVILAPAPGTTLPDDLKVDVCVWPTSKRLPEVCYPAARQDQRDRVQYYVEVQFDQDEMWQIRVRLSRPSGTEEVAAEVEATPPGYGRWDLLIYAFPIAVFGMLWLFAFIRKRRRGVRESVPSPPIGGATPPPQAS